MFKNTKEAFLNCNIDTLAREFSLLHQKQDKDDGKSDCFHSIETEVLTAIKRIKKTQPIESNQQDLLIVCKSFEDTGDDVFCVEAKDFALWKKRHLKNQPISEYISDETLTFMDRNDILDACISIKVPQAYVYIPITFDVDSAFGLDVCDTTKSRKPDYINLYINYSKNGDMELFIDYCNNSTSDGDIDVAVELTPEQYKAVKKRFETQFKNAYGISIADAIKQECKLEG